MNGLVNNLLRLRQKQLKSKTITNKVNVKSDLLECSSYKCSTHYEARSTLKQNNKSMHNTFSLALASDLLKEELHR